MSGALVTRRLLCDLLDGLGRACSGRVFLVGETSQVYEGWRSWTDAADLYGEPSDSANWSRTLDDTCRAFGVSVKDEFPGDVIPLPEGYEERARAVGSRGALEIAHFDPYSVAFRYIARGDEPDYHLVMSYMRNGWIEPDTMNGLIRDLLPRFTMQTIQQDPAEFRRKYKGLMQMASRLAPGTVHRPF